MIYEYSTKDGHGYAYDKTTAGVKAAHIRYDDNGFPPGGKFIYPLYMKPKPLTDQVLLLNWLFAVTYGDPHGR